MINNFQSSMMYFMKYDVLYIIMTVYTSPWRLWWYYHRDTEDPRRLQYRKADRTLQPHILIR